MNAKAKPLNRVLRNLLGDPVIIIGALLAIALGIGANTVIYCSSAALSQTKAVVVGDGRIAFALSETRQPQAAIEAKPEPSSAVRIRALPYDLIPFRLGKALLISVSHRAR